MYFIEKILLRGNSFVQILAIVILLVFIIPSHPAAADGKNSRQISNNFSENIKTDVSDDQDSHLIWVTHEKGKKVACKSPSKNISKKRPASNASPKKQITKDLTKGEMPAFHFPENKQVNLEKIVPSGIMPEDSFGKTVVIDQNTLLVGAPFDDTNGEDAGAVYVYALQNNEWVNIQKIPGHNIEHGEFGYSLDLLGDWAVVGAPSTLLNGQSYACILKKVNDTWVIESTIYAQTTGSRLGFSSMINEDLVVLGEPLGVDPSTQIKTGLAHISHNINNAWSEFEMIPPPACPSINEGMQFGYSFAMKDSNLFIGSPFHDYYSSFENGAVYIMYYSNGVWVTNASIHETRPYSHFGLSAWGDNERVFIGAPDADTEGIENAGLVYYFSSDLVSSPLFSSVLQPGARFGHAIDVYEDILAVSSPGHQDISGAMGEINVFRFNGNENASYWTEIETLQIENQGQQDLFADTVSVAKDLIVIGAPGDDANALNAGAAYVYKDDELHWEGSKYYFDITADNYFAVYVENGETGEISLAFRDEDGEAWDTLYENILTVNSNDKIYIAAFSNKDQAQGLFGNVICLKTGRKLDTGVDLWKVAKADDPGWSGNNAAAPSPAKIRNFLDTDPPFYTPSDEVDYGDGVWGYAFGYQGQFNSTHWIWHDGMSGENPKEYYLFKFDDQRTITVQTDGTPGASLTDGGAPSPVLTYTIPQGSSFTKTVTAQSPASHNFLNWTGYNITNPANPILNLSVENVTEDILITANFEIKSFTLSYTAGPGGSIQGPNPQTVNYGQNGQTVTAVPSLGYHFIGWSDGLLAPERTDFHVTANINVTANFAIDAFTLTYSAGSGGSVSLNSETVPYGGNGSRVMATASLGYKFSHWSGDVNTLENPLQIMNVTQNMDVVANFISVATYYITIQTDGTPGAKIKDVETGSQSQSLVYMVYEGESFNKTVEAIVPSNYAFVNWTGDITTTNANPVTITIDLVTKNMAITANFDPTQYTISGKVTVNGAPRQGAEIVEYLITQPAPDKRNPTGGFQTAKLGKRIILAVTDSQGNYQIQKPVGFTGKIYAEYQYLKFTPIFYQYTNLSAPQNNKNYAAVSADNN